MNQVREISRSYTVELPILNNTSSKISFGDNETVLDEVIITGLSLLPEFIGKAPSGRQVLSFIAAMQGFITLCDGKRQEINKSLPLEILMRNDPILHIKPRLLSIRNSYVDLPLINSYVIPAGPPPGLSLVFAFFYEDFNVDKHRINGFGEVEYIQ